MAELHDWDERLGCSAWPIVDFYVGDSAEPDRALATFTVDGVGTGCMLDENQPDEWALYQLAELAQDALTEELGRAVPRCREHDGHLAVTFKEGQVLWECPRGDFSAPIGALLRS
ncbi:MAG: hypothetical protein AB7L84_03930 [Acidimicrobiia bacterium]